MAAGCAIVLAAGAGRRAGGPKADIVVDGQRLVDRAVAIAREGGCEPVIAVIRPGTVVPGATAVVNAVADGGLATSLRLGLDAAGGTAAPFAVILLVDQPGMTSAAVARLAAAHDPQGCVWFATYAGIRDHPVRVDRSLWTDVAGHSAGEVGAKAFAQAQPGCVRDLPCDDVADPADLDTAAALQSWASGHG